MPNVRNTPSYYPDATSVRSHSWSRFDGFDGFDGFRKFDSLDELDSLSGDDRLDEDECRELGLNSAFGGKLADWKLSPEVKSAGTEVRRGSRQERMDVVLLLRPREPHLQFRTEILSQRATSTLMSRGTKLSGYEQ
jgi:hypothetical protein